MTAVLRRSAVWPVRARIPQRKDSFPGLPRAYSTEDVAVLDEILGEPTWSARDLLPSGTVSTANEISPTQLRKLLRLSALPPPKDQEEESKLLATLASQLHFVQAVRNVDTAGVIPLRALRDETPAAESAAEITKTSLQQSFDNEKRIGKHYVRIRRQPFTSSETKEAEAWDPLQCATRRSNRFFIVNGSKE